MKSTPLRAGHSLLAGLALLTTCVSSIFSNDARARLTLRIPQENSFRARVPIVFVIANQTSESRTFEVPGSPIAYDVIISAADGSHVWRRSDSGEIFVATQVMLSIPAQGEVADTVT